MKTKGSIQSKIKPLSPAFSHSIKLSGYKMGIKFDQDLLTAEQKNFTTKIINVYIVYNLHAWPRNPTSNFKFKNCLFGSTSIVKNIDQEKYVYSGYKITFDKTGWWSFDNDSGTNVMFGVDNSSSSHADNCKKNFLVLFEGWD